MRKVLGQGVFLLGVVALALTPAAGTPSAAGGLSGDGAPSASVPPPAPPPPPPPIAVPGSGSAWERALGRQAPQVVTPRSIGAAAAPALTVTPATGLVTDQVVDVAGTGFTQGELAIAECAANPTGPESCDLRTVYFISPDPSGAVAVPFTVTRTLLVSGRVVRCETAPGACTLIVTNIASSGIDAFAPLSFAGGPRPNPQIVVAPNTNLVGGDTVSVTGTGFQPNGLVQVEQCVVGVPFCNASTVDVTVNANGGFSAQLPLSLRTVGSAGEVTTCLAVQCVVEAVSIADIEDVAVADIDFDPNQPPPSAPTVTVTPATGLRHNQVVTIAGQGFDPQGDLVISQCSANSPGFCPDILSYLTVGADGTFSTQASVSRLVTEFGFPDDTVVDCVNGGCTIEADEFVPNGFVLTASAPLTFDPSEPPPPLPHVTAAPLDNLPFRAAITVHGTGFSPGEEVLTERCVDSELSGFCGGTFSVADGNGEVTVTISVKRITSGPDGDIDCIDPNVVCSIEVVGQRSYEQFRFPITFDPNAPIPPPPTMIVTPNTNLGYREQVSVQGTGFTPNAVLMVSECAFSTFPDAPTGCSGGTQKVADSEGGLDTTFVAHRIVFGGFESSIDCANGLYVCVITAGEFDEFDFGNGMGEASARVTFDPSSVPPPPPDVHVSPTRHLVDGQLVDVSGAGFSDGASIGIALCKAGPLSYADCDLSNSSVFPADSHGGFATRFAVRAQIDTLNGPVDCTVAPGTCALGVANTLDPVTERVVTPLSFDVPELPEIDLHSVSVREGTGGVTAAPVDVELSEPSTAPVTVHWNAVAGSATEGTDYTSVGGTVVIPAGATHGTIPAEVVADALDEPTERFTVVVDAVTGATIEDGDATVKIKDDDHEPDISIGDNRVREDAGVVDVPVILSAPSGRTVTVEFRTHHRSARSDHDFIRTRGVATFAPGQTLALVGVPIVDDTRHEKVESFRVELDDAEDADIGDDSATVTIVDND